MNRIQLQELLQLYPPETEVIIFDEKVSYPVPVTGAVYSSETNTLELTTDDAG